MNKYIAIVVLFFFFAACKDRPTYVQLNTTEGEIVLRLYDETPKHKENFIKLVEEGYYNGVLFHRVLNNFVIQAGDPNSVDAKPGELLGNGGPTYKIDAEFNDSLFHKKGALATANDGNPEKASHGSQFYIVEGKKYKDSELESFEKGMEYTFLDEQKEFYKKIGGIPFLDTNYTVFGEVVAGMNIVEKISDVDTDRRDRPKEDVRIISAEVVKYKVKKKD